MATVIFNTFLNHKPNFMKEKLMAQLKDLHFEAWSTSFDVLNKIPGAAAKYADICQQIDTLHFKLLKESHIINLTNHLS